MTNVDDTGKAMHSGRYTHTHTHTHTHTKRMHNNNNVLLKCTLTKRRHTLL
jgi:hypothetical protein